MKFSLCSLGNTDAEVFFVCVCVGYRHVYLEGMEEASVFVHVAVNDITGKVSTDNKTRGLKKKKSLLL